MARVPIILASLLASAMGAVSLINPRADLAVATANDNRAPAGVLARDTLRLNLVVRMARWYPEDPDGPFVDVPAFSEEGKGPSIPGPLIRVFEGTTIVATVRNELPDSTVWVHGLYKRPVKANDSTSVRPRRSHTFTFNAGAPGTYFYFAKAGKLNSLVREREQLSGAFVVDRRGARVDDRILMMNIWAEPVDSTHLNSALAINGKSWPNTERFAANIGDTLHWRVINATIRAHPMHLHGFYYRIGSRGTFRADTLVAPDDQENVVTNHMLPGATMDIKWSPNRPGNWLFHCHITPHVDHSARLGYKAEHGDMHAAMDPMKHMSGLVIGINVGDSQNVYRGEKTNVPVRRLRLYANERRATSSSRLATSYVLQRGLNPPAKDSVEPPGQVILLKQNEPTEVTIVNHAHAATSVHWHGIELESYNDGVAGWSGVAKTVAPMIAPNDSFTARLILPRAGTFIYHTHLNDIEQLASGAYGPIVVLEPGRKFDPETDHVFTIGWGGRVPRPNFRLAINGRDSIAAPVTFTYRKTHRMRIVNIGAGGIFDFVLRRDTSVMTWRPVAKDGAELPASAQRLVPARRGVSVGETFDAEWTPPARGDYMLTASNRGGRIYARQKITVR